MSTATNTEPIRHTPKNSSNITHIQFHPDEGTLIVQFHSGGSYAYDNCTPQMADAFMKAPSAGTFFHQHIKGKFASRKLSQ